jgi:hypothetical protein
MGGIMPGAHASRNVGAEHRLQKKAITEIVADLKRKAEATDLLDPEVVAHAGDGRRSKHPGLDGGDHGWIAGVINE